jgi:hypothetical protein
LAVFRGVLVALIGSAFLIGVSHFLRSVGFTPL